MDDTDVVIVCDTVTVCDHDTVGEGVAVSEAVTEGEDVKEGDDVTVADGVTVGVGDSDALNDTVLLTLGLVDAVADCIGVGDGDDAISISHMYCRLPSPTTSLNRFKYC